MNRTQLRRLQALEQRPSPIELGRSVAGYLRLMDEAEGFDRAPVYYNEIRIGVEQRVARMVARGDF